MCDFSDSQGSVCLLLPELEPFLTWHEVYFLIKSENWKELVPSSLFFPPIPLEMFLFVYGVQYNTKIIGNCVVWSLIQVRKYFLSRSNFVIIGCTTCRNNFGWMLAGHRHLKTNPPPPGYDTERIEMPMPGLIGSKRCGLQNQSRANKVNIGSEYISEWMIMLARGSPKGKCQTLQPSWGGGGHCGV